MIPKSLDSERGEEYWVGHERIGVETVWRKRVRGGRLSDERSKVIYPAKLEISLIKVVTTPVWETMVALPDSRGFVKVSDAFVERVKGAGVTREREALTRFRIG